MSKKVIVKHYEGEERFTFSFHLSLPDFKIDKQFNLNRELKEDTSAFLDRLKTNINKAKPGQKKKKLGETKSNGDNEIPVTLLLNGTYLNNEEYKTVNDFIFIKDLTFKVNDLLYQVTVNPPLVRDMRMSNIVMTELMIYPHLLEVEFANPKRTIIKWFVSEKLEGKSCEHANKKHKQDFVDSLTWKNVGTGFYYKPTISDMNCRLKCEVTPFNDEMSGESMSLISPNLITAGPGVCPTHSRHKWTQNTTLKNPREMRVVSYNLLADLYADSDYSRTVLFAQCPPYALNIEYRIKLILDEIIGYNADAICLQEVDRKVFELHLVPVLRLFGIEGQFAKKGGQVDEGLAIFFRSEKFSLIDFSSVFVPAALQTEPYIYIWDEVKDNETLVNSLVNRTTTVAVAVLRDDLSGDLVIVGNTHLYFQPNADHIRLIQVEICRSELERVRKDMRIVYPEKKVAVMLCGDFNSTPPFGVPEYMTGGSIPESHSDWRSQEGEEISGLSLSHSTKFMSAAGTPQFTNYTKGFKDCLDYIFIEEDKMRVNQVVPFPSEEELMLHTALPNIMFPSDHVSVVVDLQLL